MYYLIEEDTIKQTDRKGFFEKEDTICVITTAEWEKRKDVQEHFNIHQPIEPIHFCKLESHSSYLYGTMSIPAKTENLKTQKFTFFVLEEKLIFVDDETTVKNHIRKLTEGKLRKNYTLERFLYDFLVTFLDTDLLCLQKIEKHISLIEEGVLEGKQENFNYEMVDLKKKISKLYRYYRQLIEVGQELVDNEIDFFGKDEIRTFEMLKDRAYRLAEETQIIREYAMQVQDVYQSEIGIRQNDIMKTLTIVTTIFLPLSLIAGWYGMNFTNMPELQSTYGYPVIIFICFLIITISLYFFKKKKYW